MKLLPTLLENLINEGATNDPISHRQRLDNLLSQYKKLMSAINETSERCSIIIAGKILHEKSSQLKLTLNQMTNAPVSYQTLNDIRTGLYGQMKLVEILKKYRTQVDEIVQQARDLMRQFVSVKDVPQEVQQLEKLYQDKVRSAQELLEQLQVERNHSR